MQKRMSRFTEIYRNQKTVLKNFSFLSILQLVQMLIGLLVYPYLIKVLGTNNYGVVAYSQAIIGYAVLFVNYGFNITGTRGIAKNKKNIKKLSSIFSTVLTVKFFIFLVCFIVILLLTYWIDILNQYQLAYMITLVTLFGWVLFPDWYFQGIEKMENITYIMVVSKLVSLLLIFLLVTSPGDYLIAISINSLSMLMAGVIGLILVFKSNKELRFVKPPIIRIMVQFKSGFSYFFSNVSANTKDYVNTFIIGAFFSYSDVGIYDLIVKVIKVLLIPISILIRALFPKVSIVKSYKFNLKIEKVLFIYGVLAFCFIWLFGDIILLFMSDNKAVEHAGLCFKVMAISLPLLALTSTRGTLTLLGFNFDSSFSLGIVMSVLFYFVILIILYYLNLINMVSITYAIVASIAIELFSHIYHIHKNNIKNILT